MNDTIEFKTIIHTDQHLNGLVEVFNENFRYSMIATDGIETMAGLQHDFNNDISDDLRKEFDKIGIALTNIKNIIDGSKKD